MSSLRWHLRSHFYLPKTKLLSAAMSCACYAARTKCRFVGWQLLGTYNASHLSPLPSQYRINGNQRRSCCAVIVKNFNKAIRPAANSLVAKSFSTSKPVPAVIESHESPRNESDRLRDFSREPSSEITDIRSRLRHWEVENPTHPILDSHDQDLLKTAAFQSTLLQPEDNRTFGEDVDENGTPETPQTLFEGAELVDFGKQRTFLRRGDLVELRVTGGVGAELAIFIRQLGEQSQFYSMSGRWMHQRSKGLKFFVPGFVDPQELEPLVPFLPDSEVADALQDKLDSFRYALPRDVGSPLIRKMLEFWSESDAVYRAAASQLDNAHKIVAHKSSSRYATLHELAQEILPKHLNTNGDYPTPALYTLHRALCQDEVGFRPQRAGHHRSWGRFEISSIDEVANLDFVADEVRRYQEFLISSAHGIESAHPTKLLRFIAKAQRLIDESRKTRIFTPYGVIGTMKSTHKTSSPARDFKSEDSDLQNAFQETDRCYIRFIESWARYGTFTARSNLHGVASTILRATGRYRDFQLDHAIGWVFLQELGVIPPWENIIQSDLRLPMIIQEDEPEIPSSTRSDVLNGMRKDWGSLPVYCVDSIGTQDIDDGLSVEPAELPNEYWVHIHTADPASEIIPRSTVAQNAETTGSTIYLPERIVHMLPRTLIQNRFSLASDRPSLTFSARLNSQGDLLAYKITPGILRNIIYMTQDAVASVLGDVPFTAKDKVYTVGDDIFGHSLNMNRPLQNADDVTDTDRKNLRLLHTLAAARQSMTVAKGSVMFHRPETNKTVVAFDTDSELIRPMYATSHRYYTDPTIQFRTMPFGAEELPKADIVRDHMLMAGEIAARWCHERGIPIINRVTQRDPDRPDPREYFRQIIMPFLASVPRFHTSGELIQDAGRISSAGQNSSNVTANINGPIEVSAPVEVPNLTNLLPANIFQEYLDLLGNVLPSTTAGPHLALGLDMFSRATSPLRRYSDLVTHWQIEAALLEEAQLGSSLIGSSREDYLPFKKAEVDQLIPRLDSRERAIYLGQQASKLFWAMQFLIRAWKFGEAQLSPTFQFITKNLYSGGKWAHGDLIDLGGLRASIDLTNSFLQKDIQIGDVLEVRIIHLDAYRRRIYVEPLRRIDLAATTPLVD